MPTFLRPHFTLSRFLIAAIWVVVSLSDLTGARVVRGNIQNTLQKHEAIRPPSPLQDEFGTVVKLFEDTHEGAKEQVKPVATPEKTGAEKEVPENKDDRADEPVSSGGEP